MIIKAYNANHGTYIMYDNVVEILEFMPCPKVFRDTDVLSSYIVEVLEKDEYLDHDICLMNNRELEVLFDRGFRDGEAFTLNTIKFKRSDGKSYRVTVENDCFICNDAGKTLERVRAGGLIEDSSMSFKVDE